MKNIPDNYFDLCLCDPPYVDLEENTGTIRTTGNVQAKLELGGKPKDEVFQEIFRVSKHQIIWGANNFGYQTLSIYGRRKGFKDLNCIKIGNNISFFILI